MGRIEKKIFEKLKSFSVKELFEPIRFAGRKDSAVFAFFKGNFLILIFEGI